MTKRLLVSVVVLASLFGGCRSEKGSVRSREQDELRFAGHLQKVLDLVTDLKQGTGISAAVTIPGQGSWVGASGVSEATTPVRPDMLFDIASIGKNYLAALILQLAEEGKLMLDDPIHRWLPDYPNIERTITIRQLLNHTSGVFDWVEHPQSPFKVPFHSIDFTRIWTQDEILTTLVGQPYFPPGNGWHYSTTNYNLLRMIAEDVTQSRVSVELRTRFLEPLNLNHTFILDSETSIPDGSDIAHGWYDGDGDGSLDDISSKPRTWIATLSPAMMYSTAGDLARWSQALYQGEVLGQEHLEQMLSFHRPTPGEPPVTGYGLGTEEFAHKTIQGLRAWGHLGWQYGYMAAMLYFPDDSTSVVILINDNNQECITYAGLGLWLVTRFHNSNTPFVAAAYSLVLFLSMLVIWPAAFLWRRVRTRKPGAAEEDRKKQKAAGIARVLAMLTTIVILGVLFLFIVHLFNPQGPLDWTSGSIAEKAILGLALVGTAFSLILVLLTFRAWKNRYWSIAGRIHYTLITLAALSSVYLFQVFHFLPF